MKKVLSKSSEYNYQIATIMVDLTFTKCVVACWPEQYVATVDTIAIHGADCCVGCVAFVIVWNPFDG